VENKMTNEIAKVEVVSGEVVREEKNYVVTKNEEGKFVRKAKYNAYSSVQAESREDKIWLMNLYEGAEGTGNGLKDHVGKIIEVANVITRPYDKINEETGETEYGVLTYLLTPDKIAYVTSSKNVYFSLNNILDLFGRPDEEGWENIKIKVLKERGANGDMIKIKMVG
jgi:Phage Single-stranded DNA-binding protein